MSVIRTKYLGPTNTKSARIKATLATASVTLPYDWELSGNGNHDRVARELAIKLNLLGQWARVWDQSQSDGNTYVCLPDCKEVFVL